MKGSFVSAFARIVAVSVFAGALLAGNPFAQRGVVRRQIATIDGRAVAAGEVLVKFRRALDSFERGRVDQLADADENHLVGSAGVRRVHSRRHATEKLIELLRQHPDVEYVEPNVHHPGRRGAERHDVRPVVGPAQHRSDDRRAGHARRRHRRDGGVGRVRQARAPTSSR